MNGEAWIAAAAHLPAPVFVLIVAGLAIFSIGGVPVPITATLLVAGALTTRLPHGPILFGVLVVALTVALTLRDGVTLLLGRHGEQFFHRRGKTVHASAQHMGIAVRSAHIALPATRMERQLRQRAARRKRLVAIQTMLLHQGALVLALTRLSPLASPFDIAAGVLGMPLRRFIPPIAAGRLLYSLLLLGAGALSATAWRRGASLPQLAAIGSIILIVLLILTGIISRRAIERQPDKGRDVEPGISDAPVIVSR
jgi:membrane protein DedA with SNARE-associated domain